MNQSDALRRLRALGGVARYSAIGAEKRVLDALVRKGKLVRPARGCYAVPGAQPALVKAVILNAVVTCVSAARLHGYEVPGDDAVLHCAIPSRRGPSRHRAGVHVHYAEPERYRGLPIATPAAALAAAVFCLRYEDAVATLDAVCDRPKAPSLSAVLAQVRARSARMADALAIDADTTARSTVESDIRLALRRAGLHVMANVQILGVGEVDLLVEGQIVLELDGFAYHSGRKAFRGDRRRDRNLLRFGFIPMRFAWEDCRPRLVREAVADVLAVLRGTRLQPHPEVSGLILRHLEEVRAECLLPEQARVGRPGRG